MENNDLYYSDRVQPLQGSVGSEGVITGRPEVDDYLLSLPEQERDAALARISAPMTGKELWEKRNEDRNFVPTFDQFQRIREYRRTLDSEVLQSIGAGLDMFLQTFGDAISHTAQNPLEVGGKIPASLVEAFWQGSRDMYGMVAEAEDPASVLFGLKSVLTGNGSDEEQYQQYLQALEFQRKSERLFNGEETLLMDKRLIDEKFTRAAAFVVDPSTFVPFGGLVAKGAKAAGMGEAMLRASLRANTIKNAVYGGAIKIGIGVPLDIIGGATRNTIEWGASKAAAGLENFVGIPVADTERVARMAGIGTASAHIAGYSLPYAGTAATAWAGGTALQSVGQAAKMIGERYIRNHGERGVLSFAREIIEDSKNLHPNLRLSKGTENVLRVLDKADPFLSYTADIAEGAAGGALIGGGLGYLSAQGEGFGMGFGTGLGLGATGALVGRGLMDATGAIRKNREAVQAYFMLEVLKDKDPESYKSWNKLLSHPLATPKMIELINKQIVGIHSTTDNVKVHALWDSAEYKDFVAKQEAVSKGEAGMQSNDPPPAAFERGDAFTYIRRNNGNVDMVINLQNIFSPSKKYSGLTMAHEFGHALFKHNVLGPHFTAQFRDMMLGVRNADGVLVEGPMVPFGEVKEFFQKYNQAYNVWSRLGEIKAQQDPAARAGMRKDAQESFLEFKTAIDKLEREQVGQKSELTEGEMQALYRMAEEFGAYTFSAWFNERPMEFFLKGGELDGIQGMIDNVKNSFADMMESRISPHEPRFDSHKIDRGKEIDQFAYKRGKRVRLGTLDAFYREMIRSASQIKNRGFLDLERAGTGYLDTLLNKGLSEIVTRDPKTKKARVKTAKEFEVENANKGSSIFRILESMTPEDSAGGMTIGLNGNFQGKFNEMQLRALETAGIFTPEETAKIRLFQRADLAERGTVPNEFTAQYFGKSMGVSRWDDNQRVRGNRVAFKNRTFVLGHTDFEFGNDGTYRLNLRVLDSEVITMRGKEVWLNEDVKRVWNNDFDSMMADFYEKYLANLSKDPADPMRKPTAEIFGVDGDRKRDILHQIAGFAKSIDLPYANTPASVVTRGTMSSVMDLSLGRMIGVRTTGRSYKYNHNNAFWDVSRNYKLDTDMSPENGKWSVVEGPDKLKRYSTFQKDKDGSVAVDVTETRAASGKKGYTAKIYLTSPNGERFRESMLESESVKNIKQELQDHVAELQKDWRFLRIAYEERGVKALNDEMTNGNEPLDKELVRVAQASRAAGDIYRVPEIQQKVRDIPESRRYRFSLAESITAFIGRANQKKYESGALAYDVRAKEADFFRVLREVFGIDPSTFNQIPNHTSPYFASKASSQRRESFSGVGHIERILPLVVKEDGATVVKVRDGKDSLAKQAQAPDPHKTLKFRDRINGTFENLVALQNNPSRSIREGLRRQADGTPSLAASPDRMPSIMSIFKADNPEYVVIKAGETRDYETLYAPLFRKNNPADVLTVVSMGKLIDMLTESVRNPSKYWSPMEMSDAVTYVLREKDINKVHVSDIGQGSDFGQTIKETQDTGPAREQYDPARMQGAPFVRTKASAFPTRAISQTAGNMGIPAWDIKDEVTTAFNKAAKNTWSTKFMPMMKLDTEYGYATEAVRQEFMRPENRNLAAFREEDRVAGSLSIDELRKLYEEIKAAGKARLLSRPAMMSEAEFDASQGEILKKFLQENREAALNDRYYFWVGELYEKVADIFKSISNDNSSYWMIQEPIRRSDALANFAADDSAARDYLTYADDIAFNETHFQLLSKTSPDLLLITDRPEKAALSNNWKGRMDEILKRYGATDVDGITDLDDIKEYFTNAGRIRALEEIADVKNIEAIKARFEQISGGLLSAEVILRPNHRVYAENSPIIERKEIWDRIGIIPEGERLNANFTTDNHRDLIIQPRVTIVWGPKAIEMREFVRSYTGQPWRSAERGTSYAAATSMFRFDRDNSNPAIAQRVQTDPQFVEKVKEITALFNAGKQAMLDSRKTAFSEHLKYEAVKHSGKRLPDYDAYKEQYKDEEDSIRYVAERDAYRSLVIDKNLHRGGNENADNIREAFIQRQREDAYEEIHNAFLASGDIGPLIKHIAINHFRESEKMTWLTSDDSIRSTVIDFEVDTGKEMARIEAQYVPSEIVTLARSAYSAGKNEFKNLAYKDTFKPNLPRAIREVFAALPQGISANNLRKELEKMHSKGIKVKDEMKYTGFSRWLDEQAKKPKVNGKDPKLDPVETLAFIDSTQLGVRLEQDPRLNIDTYSGGTGSYHAGGLTEKYGIIGIKAVNKPYFPSNASQHLVNPQGSTDYSTIAHARYTYRRGIDDALHLHLEEGQANNNLTHMATAGTALTAINYATSPEIANAINRAIDDAIASKGDPDEFRIESIASLIENSGTSGSDFTNFIGTSGTSSLRDSLFRMGNIGNGKWDYVRNISGTARQSGFVPNARDKFVAKQWTQNMGKSLQYTGNILGDSAEYASRNFGGFVHDMAFEFVTDSTGVLQYGAADEMSIKRTAANGKKFKNIEHYDFQFSPEGKATVRKIFATLGAVDGNGNTVINNIQGGEFDRHGPWAVSAWLQGQIASVFTPEVMNKVMRELMEYCTEALEQEANLLSFDNSEIQKAASKTKDFDKNLVILLKKYAPKVVNTSVGKSVMDKLIRNAAELDDSNIDVQSAVNDLSKYTLSREDIIKAAPLFFSKVVSPANQVRSSWSGGSLKEHQTLTFNKDQKVGGWSLKTTRQSVEIGHTHSGLYGPLMHIAFNRKIATFLKNSGRRIAEGEMIIDGNLTYSTVDWANDLSKRERKQMWDGTDPQGVNARNLENLFDYSDVGQDNLSAMTSAHTVFNQVREMVFGKGDAFEPDGSVLDVSDIRQTFTPFFEHARLIVDDYSGERQLFTNTSDLSKEFAKVIKVSGNGQTVLPATIRSPITFARYLLTKSISRSERYGWVDNTQRYVTNRTLPRKDGLRASSDVVRELQSVHGDTSMLKKIADRVGEFGQRNTSTYGGIVGFMKEWFFDKDKPPFHYAMIDQKELKARKTIADMHDASSLRDILTLDGAIEYTKAIEGVRNATPENRKAVLETLQKKMRENLILLGISGRGVHAFGQTSGVAEKVFGTTSYDDIKSAPDNKKIEFLSRLAEFPHMQTKEWSRLMALSLVRNAVQNGLDYVTIQHPHEAGAVSGLDWVKADTIYGIMHASGLKSVAKDAKIPVVERTAPDMNPDSIRYKTIMDNKSVFDTLWPVVLKQIKVPSTDKRNDSYMHSWFGVKDSTVAQIESYIKNKKLNTTSEYLVNSIGWAPKMDNEPRWGTKAFIETKGGDDYERQVFIFGNSEESNLGSPIMNIIENAVIRKLKGGKAKDSTLVSEVVDMLDTSAADIKYKTDVLIYRTFISKDAVDTDDMRNAVVNFLEPSRMAEIKNDYPEVHALLEIFKATRSSADVMAQYGGDIALKAVEESSNAGEKSTDKYANWMMRNRGTTIGPLKTSEGAKKIATEPNAMFKLDNGVSGSEFQIGDWEWRNRPLGTSFRKVIGNKAEMQFIHEVAGDKVIGTLRIVPRGNEDSRTEDGRAIEAKVHLDVQHGVAYETYLNEPTDPAWRQVVTDELELRMRTLGAMEYSAEPMAPETNVVPMGVIGRKDKERLAPVEQTEPAMKVQPEQPKQVAFERKNLNNGTAFTSAEGYFIAVINNKFRLYGANKALVGVYATEQEARRKADALARKGKKQ